MNVWQEQHGGNHYKNYAIQPTEYNIKNGLNFCEGNVVKYITRWRDKGGLVDLLKAKHYIEMLIETEKDNERNRTTASSLAHAEVDVLRPTNARGSQGSSVSETQGAKQVQPKWYAARDPFFKHESDGVGVIHPADHHRTEQCGYDKTGSTNLGTYVCKCGWIHY